nr:hypothetical protein BaRGS_030846 [Batillaria attramentaria]
MKGAVDPLLRDQQAGFRQNRSCVDQIATLRIIVEQSLEWNSPLYVNFVDYEKAFDSVDRETLWKLLRHYGVPAKLVNLIKNSYDGMTCRIIHGGQLTDSFHVKTGVRQGCLLSPFLFFLAIDWIMKTSTAQRRNGIQWTLWTQLEDLDFADDLALLSQGQRRPCMMLHIRFLMVLFVIAVIVLSSCYRHQKTKTRRVAVVNNGWIIPVQNSARKIQLKPNVAFVLRN